MSMGIRISVTSRREHGQPIRINNGSEPANKSLALWPHLTIVKVETVDYASNVKHLCSPIQPVIGHQMYV